ncbi:unnamed protein product, partial [Ectocarpus sp. 8 AP-2014]
MSRHGNDGQPGQDRVPPVPGLTTAHQNASASREPSRPRSLSRRVSYGSQLSGSLQAGAPDTRAYATRVRTGGSSSSGFGTEGGALQGDKDEHGLKLLGSLSDVFGDEMVEIYLGSFHQQALISEAKKVLSQPRNRGLGVELVAGVAAVGVGRNSIGAVITTSRPYKKVTLEMSASMSERECPDPKGYISTTLAVIEDATGVSNLFVLDLCDTTNAQDPRDGRTSLMTAVLDNNETLVERLLVEGVDIAVTDTLNRTALLHSVISKHDAITQLLL